MKDYFVAKHKYLQNFFKSFLTIVSKDKSIGVYLRFEVSVNYPFGVKGFHSTGYLFEEQSYGILRKTALSLEIVCEISSIAVLHNEKDMSRGFFTI